MIKVEEFVRAETSFITRIDLNSQNMRILNIENSIKSLTNDNPVTYDK